MKKLVLLFSVFALLSLLGCPPVDDPENGGGGTDVVVEKLPTPYISLAEGSKLIKGAKLEFHCDVEGVKFYYTVDGTDPTLASASANFYEVQISKGTLLINLIATKDGYENSDVCNGIFEVVDEKAPTSFSFNEEAVYVEEGGTVALGFTVSPVGTEKSIKIEVKKNDTETVNTITYDYSTVSTTNAAAGVYTITASYDGLESQKATIYVWEYKDVTQPTTEDVDSGTTVESISGTSVGENWTFLHGAGTAKTGSTLKVGVGKSKTFSGDDTYQDDSGNNIPDTYGFFVDKMGGAIFSASLLKKETLAAGLYALEAQNVGNAEPAPGDDFQIKIGDKEMHITNFNVDPWNKSLRHVTDFYRANGTSEVEYGVKLSTVQGSGFWGFVHSFKLRYIPEN